MIGTTRQKIELFVISFLALFLQMACIRWLPSQVRVLAYYTNIVLLAAFLGLSVGYLLSARKFRCIWGFPFALLLIMAVSSFFSEAEVLHDQNLYMWQTLIEPIRKISLHWLLPAFFLMVSLIFIPLGQQTGKLFDKLPPILAYTLNIFGSVMGIAVYSILSYKFLPPLWLFAVFMVLYLYFFLTRTNRLFTVVTAVIFAGVLIWIAQLDKGTFWSPYYKIQVSKLSKDANRDEGFNLTVNNDYHQMALNLSESKTKNDKGLREWAKLYELPFRIYPGQVEDALIVGAGTGNDVAAALRTNVRNIDAVDIDPLIIKIGKKLHPEYPYNDKRVSIHNDDARSFFKKTDKKYDVIVFGFLDSHQLFARMSDIRLDTYVYTVESFKEAKSLLKQGGVLSVTFCVTKGWIGNRLFEILKEATGQTPLILSSGDEPNGFTFVYGVSPDKIKDYTILPTDFFGKDKIAVSHDDWPFFYMKDRKIPVDYLIVIAIMLIISLFMIIPTGSVGIGRFQSSFFFLGAGFLLFETTSLTKMSLLFGSTWIVNSAVFTAIFVTILISNFYCSKISVKSLIPYYFMLFAAFLLNYFFPIHMVLKYGMTAKFITAGILIGLPIFFSGVIFVVKFQQTDKRSIAMGSNLIGAMLGGILEYSSILVGFKNLIFLIILLYILSIFQFRKKDSPQE
ncbi:MAG: hypothetical protein RBU23_06715 [Candidatus Auribacterota bacterium]|jgi:hypothetical protein|nr:hypothetical protein [Candidatus Auribacterota bacterium]